MYSLIFILIFYNIFYINSKYIIFISALFSPLSSFLFPLFSYHFCIFLYSLLFSNFSLLLSSLFSLLFLSPLLALFPHLYSLVSTFFSHLSFPLSLTFHLSFLFCPCFYMFSYFLSSLCSLLQLSRSSTEILITSTCFYVTLTKNSPKTDRLKEGIAEKESKESFQEREKERKIDR